MPIIFESKHLDLELENDDSIEMWKITGDDEITALSDCPGNHPRYVFLKETPAYFIEQLEFMLDEGWSIYSMTNEFAQLVERINNALFQKIKALKEGV